MTTHLSKITASIISHVWEDTEISHFAEVRDAQHWQVAEGDQDIAETLKIIFATRSAIS
jgi:hypothetical protein